MKNNYRLPLFSIGFVLTYIIISLITVGTLFISPIEIISGLGFMMAFGFGVPEVAALIIGSLGLLGVCSLGALLIQKLAFKLIK